MSRATGRVAWLLGLFLAGALPAQRQQWVGERLCAPQLPSGAEFGAAVAVSDDGTIAVGAYRHDRVYLFRRDAADRCEQFAEIRSPSPNAWFGFALAIHGNQLLVGAPKSGGTGAAYLYELPAATLPQTVTVRQTLTVPQAQRGDEVGSSVAIYDGTLALGARGTDGRRGRVYFRSEGAFQAVPVEGLAPNAELGQSVALNRTTLVMGAPSPYHGSGSPGAAWVFDLASRTLLPPLVPPGGLEPEAAFGYAVAVDGEHILIGAPLANRNGVVDSGAVFRFKHDGTEGAALSLPSHPGDQLGVAVALDDGVAVVGARYVANQRGEAYLKTNSLLQPLEQVVPIFQGVRVPGGAQFGSSVAIRGDTVVVGAFRQTPGGAAYRFDAVVEPPVVTVELAAAPSDVLESAGKVPLQVIIRGPAGGLSAPVTVNLQIEPGTARHRDFNLPNPGPHVFPVGTLPGTYQLAEVEIVLDAEPEGPETFKVLLSVSPTEVTGGRSDHTVTIHESFLMVPAGPLQTSEGGSAPLEVRLAVQPTEEVVVSLSTSDPGEGLVSRDRLVLDNSQQAKTVQVMGQDDALCEDLDEPRDYQILVRTTSADRRYDGLSLAIPAENADDELACLAAAERTVCTDGGGTVVYTIALINEVSDVPDAPAELRYTLPSGVSVVTASADRGIATVDPVDNSVRWVGTVPPEGGGAATLTIVAALDEPPGPILENRPDLTYDRDASGHQETIPIAFEGVEILPCP